MGHHVQIARDKFEVAVNATSLATSILLAADKEVEVHKNPNGVYYVRFQWKGKAVNRSCRTKDRRLAKPIAKRIRQEYIQRLALGQPTSATENKDRKLSDILKLFKRYVFESDKAPAEDTAHKYVLQLRSWIKILDVNTVSELKQAYEDFSLKKENGRRKKAGEEPLSKGGYASSIRGASGIFSQNALKFYKRNGFHVENPFAGEIPEGEIEKFIVPPGGLDFIKELFEAAERGISTDPQMYPIFLLCLGAGLRVQEAAHANWEHIRETGIYVRCDEVHQTKNRKYRLVPAGDSLKQRLLALKPADTAHNDFIAPNLRNRTTGKGKCKTRCDRRIRKLNAWLRTQGVSSHLTSHPCHYLRKLFGASILTRHFNGLELAKKYLGHGSIDITERIYVDLLETPEVDVLPEIETKMHITS